MGGSLRGSEGGGVGDAGSGGPPSLPDLPVYSLFHTASAVTGVITKNKSHFEGF